MYYYDDERKGVVRDLSLRKELSEEQVNRSVELIDKGEAYEALRNSRGWKLLVEEFIRPRLQVEAFLSASHEELPYIQHEMRILTELLNFVESKIQQSKLEKELLDKLKRR